MMTKKNELVGVVLVTCCLFVLGYFYKSLGFPREFYKSVAEPFFYIFIALLPFSLITYPMHERVFRVWRNFALVLVPLIIFLVVITPDTSGSIVAFGKETVAMILSIVFSALSIAIICVTWTIEHFKKKRK